MGKSIGIQRVIHSVMHTIHKLLKVRKPKCNFTKRWPDVLQQPETFRGGLKVKQVLWEFPSRGQVNYNKDGASRGNLRVSSYAFSLRYAEWDLIYSEAAIIDDTTNTITEAMVSLHASNNCKQSGYDQVIFLIDSLLFKKVLSGEQACPWNITHIIEKIQDNIHYKNIIHHIYKEQNNLVDYLANHAINSGNYTYEHFRSMQTHTIKIIRSEKLQSPYL